LAPKDYSNEMKKYIPHISISALTFVLIFATSGLIFPQTAHAAWWDPTTWMTIGDFATDILLSPLGWLAILLLQLASLITYLSGIILNYVVQFTVVDMKDHLFPAGGGNSINTAWKVIRDVANMSFIFVLLYAAIRTILGIGSDTKKLIVNIVVVAILINFSLFFTKTVIDASNVLAVTFYDAIAPSALRSNLSLGLSGSLMEPLMITSLMKTGPNAFAGKQLIIVGIMGTIVVLIAAFVFFAVAIMFVIRFVVLIFVLILSPLAFMGFILPQLNKYKDQWLDALLGQAFFAPIYFMLTWIVIIVSRGLLTNTGGEMSTVFTGIVGLDGNVKSPEPASIALLVNFIIMIVLLIASLIIAKQWADKAGHGVPGLTKWAMGAAGGASFGLAGRFGRNTVGAGADRLAQSEGFQRWAGRSIVGQTLLKGTRKAAKSSFDLRATKVGGVALGQVDAGQAELGGFESRVQKKTGAREKFAQALRSPQAKEAYAARISRGPITRGGTRSSGNTVFGALGRHNRVAASIILNNQLGPLETQEQNLQNRETQLSQQLTNMNNELGTINATPAVTRTPAQNARLAVLNGPVGNRNSIAYIQDQLTTTQANLARITIETNRIRGIIAANQLTNPANQIVNPVTGAARDIRADEQHY